MLYQLAEREKEIVLQSVNEKNEVVKMALLKRGRGKQVIGVVRPKNLEFKASREEITHEFDSLRQLTLVLATRYHYSKMVKELIIEFLGNFVL